MFSRKKKRVEKKDELKSTIDQDLIIHNMPRGLSKGKGSSLGLKMDSESGSSQLLKSGTDDFKKIGALIIALGVILIAALIFFSYRYIIKPKDPANEIKISPTPAQDEDQGEDLDHDKEESELELEVNTDTELEVDEDIIVVGDGDAEDPDSGEAMPDDEGELDETPLMLIDTDGDGLYDAEEIILGTDINMVDSDGDGYSDLHEVLNNYNPVGSGELKENPALSLYNSPVANYSILYPNAWKIGTTHNDYTLIITAGDSSVIQVTVQANIKMQNILTWYAKNVMPGVLGASEVQTTDNWEGIMSEDGRYFYLTDVDKSNIYAISYEPAIKDQIAYPNIFQMIINSLTIH